MTALRTHAHRAAAVVERPEVAGSASVASYGSQTFEQASRFVRGRAGTGDAAVRRRLWFLDVRGAAALVRLVRAEPVEAVVLTRTPAGRRIRESLRGRTLGVPRNRLCVAVLSIPAAVPARPSGNRNRALRAALNVADREGIGVRAVADPGERARLATAAARRSPRLQQWSTTAAARGADEWWAAEDADGGLVGLAVHVADREWASLVTLIGFGDATHSSTARFVLHHALTRDLSARGVTRLAVLDDSPLLVGPGTRHVQRVLGYRLVRLRPPVVVDA